MLSVHFQADDDDDMDILFAQYELEAAADRAKVESKLNKPQKPNLSMKDIREAGLSEPIAQDNRYAPSTKDGFDCGGLEA